MTDISPSTNNAPQIRQQHNSYPSPHSYPSPSMQPTYSYPPPQGQQASEQYRASPTGSNVSLPSLNLPPIRAIDGQSQPPPPPPQPPYLQQSAPAGQHQTGSPLPPPVANMSGYYPQQTHGMPNLTQPMGITSSPQAMGMRYPLPAQGQDQRIMSGGRHKKEIKRRTKTGCLTCRKRRIKCDEAHPTCRNCQKSKRECLGYDPIFKPQASPAQLQPAPSASPTPSSSIQLPSAPQYPAVSQGHPPPTSSNYGQSAPSQHSGGSSAYDFGPAIDPALAHTEMSHAQSQHDSVGQHGDSRGTAPGARPQPGVNPAHRVRIEDLFSISGLAPPALAPRTGHPSPAAMEEAQLVYHQDYAAALDRFLETKWYTQRSWPKLINDIATFSLFLQMLERFKTIKSDDFRGMQLTRSLETKVVWTLLCLPRSPDAAANGVTGTRSPEEALQLLEVQKRLDAFEALLAPYSNPLERSPVMDIQYTPSLPSAKYWEVEFWRLLSQTVSGSPQSSDPAVQSTTTDESMSQARRILAMCENRDVLYSMMVCRFVGPRLPDWPEGVKDPFNNDQNDPRTMVSIAKKFIEDEAGGKGTTQVVQRICDMSVRSWSLGR